jgi:hypothetical protein
MPATPHDSPVERFQIPAPPPSATLSHDPLAVAEGISFAEGKAEKHRARWDWNLRFWQKTVLFVFGMILNAYWSHQIVMMLWRSGSAGSGFRLDNAVLIALVTTSIANFLALVTVMAKNLFPQE